MILYGVVSLVLCISNPVPAGYNKSKAEVTQVIGGYVLKFEDEGKKQQISTYSNEYEDYVGETINIYVKKIGPSSYKIYKENFVYTIVCHVAKIIMGIYIIIVSQQVKNKMVRTSKHHISHVINSGNSN